MRFHSESSDGRRECPWSHRCRPRRHRYPPAETGYRTDANGLRRPETTGSLDEKRILHGQVAFQQQIAHRLLRLHHSARIFWFVCYLQLSISIYKLVNSQISAALESSFIAKVCCCLFCFFRIRNCRRLLGRQNIFFRRVLQRSKKYKIFNRKIGDSVRSDRTEYRQCDGHQYGHLQGTRERSISFQLHC